MNALPLICRMLEEVTKRHEQYEPARAFAQSLLFSELHKGGISRKLVEGPNAVTGEGQASKTTSIILQDIDESLGAMLVGMVGRTSDQHDAIFALRELIEKIQLATKIELSVDQTHWASKRRQKITSKKLRELLIAQNGKCALSNVDLLFDKKERTPVAGGPGCHPLSPAIDHISPGSLSSGVQLTCYALNDLKGHLPLDCFEALRQTQAWGNLMERWKKQATDDPGDREAFFRLLRPN